MSESYFSFRGRHDKILRVVALLPDCFSGDVLDVGCDMKTAANIIEGRYMGVDLYGEPDIRANAECGLPFQDKSFDSVMALDLLEHCDQIHFVFDELCRVAKSYVLVGLPNMYEWHFRLNYLLGNNISGKYGLPAEPVMDRHRWLLNLDQAVAFVQKGCERNRFHLVEEAFGFYEYNRPLPKLLNALGHLLKQRSRTRSLFIYHYVAVIKSLEAPSVTESRI